MVLLALLLIAAGLAAAVALVLGGNAATVDLKAFDYPLNDIPLLAVFGGGALVMFVVMFGVALLQRTARRKMDRRREIADLRDDHEDSLRRLEDENAALAQELEHARGRGLYGGATSSMHPFTRNDTGLVRGYDAPTSDFPRP